MSKCTHKYIVYTTSISVHMAGESAQMAQEVFSQVGALRRGKRSDPSESCGSDEGGSYTSESSAS